MNPIAFLINRNRLSSLRAMTDWLLRFQIETVIIDNASTFPPLLHWYSSCNVEVMRMPIDYGHTVGWSKQLIRQRTEGEFILSDSDLDLSKIPDDWLEVLARGLRDSGLAKCGFSLELNDLPSCYPLKQSVTNWESRFWKEPASMPEYFVAGIDTTFALYGRVTIDFEPAKAAWRTDRPYTARHLPWYINPAQLDEEEAYFLAHAGPSSSYARALKRHHQQPHTIGTLP